MLADVEMQVILISEPLCLDMLTMSNYYTVIKIQQEPYRYFHLMLQVIKYEQLNICVYVYV